ncbi:hypothetical protein Efla_003511 [Eimeria flavescens]
MNSLFRASLAAALPVSPPAAAGGEGGGGERPPIGEGRSGRPNKACIRFQTETKMAATRRWRLRVSSTVQSPSSPSGFLEEAAELSLEEGEEGAAAAAAEDGPPKPTLLRASNKATLSSSSREDRRKSPIVNSRDSRSFPGPEEEEETIPIPIPISAGLEPRSSGNKRKRRREGRRQQGVALQLRSPPPPRCLLLSPLLSSTSRPAGSSLRAENLEMRDRLILLVGSSPPAPQNEALRPDVLSTRRSSSRDRVHAREEDEDQLSPLAALASYSLTSEEPTWSTILLQHS